MLYKRSFELISEAETGVGENGLEGSTEADLSMEDS